MLNGSIIIDFLPLMFKVKDFVTNNMYERRRLIFNLPFRQYDIEHDNNNHCDF